MRAQRGGDTVDDAEINYVNPNGISFKFYEDVKDAVNTLANHDTSPVIQDIIYSNLLTTEPTEPNKNPMKTAKIIALLSIFFLSSCA